MVHGGNSLDQILVVVPLGAPQSDNLHIWFRLDLSLNLRFFLLGFLDTTPRICQTGVDTKRVQVGIPGCKLLSYEEERMLITSSPSLKTITN